MSSTLPNGERPVCEEGKDCDEIWEAVGREAPREQRLRPDEVLQLSANKYVVETEQASAKTYYYGTIAGLAIASGLITSLAFARKKMVGKKSEEDFEALL